VTQKGEEYALNELRGIEAKIKDIVATGKDSRAELSELEVQKAELEKALAALTGTRLDSYVAAGRMDEARSSLKQAVEKNPQNKLYRFNYGVLLLKEGNHSAAVEQFEAAVTVDPTFEDALYNLGIANLQWGGKRRSEAEAATRGDKQKKIDRSYEQQFNKGKEALERLRDLKPNDPDVWEALGQAYANLNMAKAAEEAFKKADSLRQGK
jgi:tetratricopeptide (TPR) repeat protein